jgi:hypothetical protein
MLNRYQGGGPPDSWVNSHGSGSSVYWTHLLTLSGKLAIRTTLPMFSVTT